MLPQSANSEQAGTHSTHYAEDQRKAIFNILEDVTDQQEALKNRLRQVQVLRKTLENLTVSVLPQKVMDTVARSINEIVPYYSLSYIIWQGEGVKFTNVVYLYAKGPIGGAYIANLQKDMVNFAKSLPRQIINRTSVIEQVSGKMYPEFLSGFYSAKTGLKPATSMIVPFKLRSGEEGNSYIMGMFHIASVNPREKPGEEEIQIIHDIANISAVNIERIKNIAATEQARLASLLRSMSNGVILFDHFQTILLSNPAAMRMLGLLVKQPEQQQQVLFSEVEGLLNGNGVDFSSKVTSLLQEGKDFHIEEFTLASSTYEIFLTPVRDIAGDIIGGAVILHDITHRVEVSRKESEFISIASHQLRTPMTGIQWVVERFMKKEKLSKAGMDYLNDIHTSVQRLTELVDLLLNASRIEAGRVGVLPQELEVIDFIKAYVEESSPLLDKKNLTIIFNEHPRKLIIHTDAGALRNIIQSLVSNAMEYTPAHGTVTIRVEKKEKTFLLAISDTGIGIPKEEQADIFDKFTRGSNAKLVKTDGTGLGLYITKTAVELLGGTIKMESKTGKGTTFFVELPLKSIAKAGERGLS
jgi:signal transduction histidine kinase